ncbi:hypothetical protein KKH23_07380 [Patescibacteria group bacterium]|nr:hypothetical protein [Patescibacteria group bacterium]
MTTRKNKNKLISVPLPCLLCDDGLLVHRPGLDDTDYYGFECDSCGNIEYEERE